MSLEKVNIEALTDRLLHTVRSTHCSNTPSKELCTAEGQEEKIKTRIGDFWARHESYAEFSTCPCWLGDGQCAREILESKYSK